MDFTTALLSVLTIHLLAAISPGPDFAVVWQKTLDGGPKAGISCGLGVCTGLLVHISYSVAGLATVITHSLILAQIIGVLGGSYLAFLGYQSLKSSFANGGVLEPEKKSVKRNGHFFYSGFIVNLFNPKAALYFVSLFSIVVSPSMGATKLLLVVALILMVQMSWYLSFIYLISLPKIRVQFNKKLYLIKRLLGALMLLMGLYMILHQIG